jgi:hypothetical protein
MAARDTKLEQTLKAQAARYGLCLAYDTHYDAENWELSWWQGNVLHRLDFQPMDSGEIQVHHYLDKFPGLPRLLQWAHNTIPMFPYLAKMEWSKVAALQPPISETAVIQCVVNELATRRKIETDS